MATSSRRSPAGGRSALLGRLSYGPLVGLRDSLNPTVSNDPQRATVVENMVPTELDKPSAFIGRPGFTKAGGQLGASAKRTGQWVGQFTKLNGTEYTVAIVGGQGIWTYNWSTDTWTNVVTVANLTTASITLSETARVYAVTFNNTLVISDGTNVPFTWDGQSGAAGLTKLTNVPVMYGQPVVYYAKLFAIKNTARGTIMWSEELDATTGYDQTGYTNYWTIGQTDQEPIIALASTNDALYCFRAYSTTAIYGAVNATFSTTGTRDAISQTIGTSSPASVYVHNSTIYWIDAQGRPQSAPSGGKPMEPPLYYDCLESLSGSDHTVTNLANVLTTYDPGTGLILFGLVELSQTNPSMTLAVNPMLNNPVSIWRGFTYQAIGQVKDGDGKPVLMHLSNDGYAYAHGTLDGTKWDDGFAAGTTAIRHVIEGPHLGGSSYQELRFTRADVQLRSEGEVTSFSFRFDTPNGTADSQNASFASGYARWDEENWDGFYWASGTVQAKKAFGFNAVGRWIRPRVSHEVAGERFGFESVSVEFTPTGHHPSIP